MKLPYRYRGLATTIALLVLLPAAAWRYALHDTVRTAAECMRLRAEISAIPDTDENIAVGSYGRQELILSGLLLDHIGRDVRVTGYTPAVTERQGSLVLHTAEIAMVGTFAELLQIMQRLEREVPECTLRSAVWRLTEDRATKNMQLTLTLYIQQIRKTDSL